MKYGRFWKVKRLPNIFKARLITRTIHTGIGFDTGDGMNIEDRVVELGRFPWTWGTIRLGVKINTKQNHYSFNGLTGKYK